MILTVTPNPSIDITQNILDDLDIHGVNRSTHTITQAAGKGVNVARVIHSAGLEVTAFISAPEDGIFASLLPPSGPHVRTISASFVRTNITLVDRQGTTKINSPGPEDTDGYDFLRALEEEYKNTTPHSWVVLAGSLPPGFPDDWYVKATVLAHQYSLKVAVDTSGSALLSIASEASRNPAAAPEILKPNAHELVELQSASYSLTGDLLEKQAQEGEFEAIISAARTLNSWSVDTVLVSLGSAGAALVTAHEAWFCPTPQVEVKSTVGAGDSALAGYIIAAERNEDLSSRLSTAVAHGSAAVTLAATTLPTPADLPSSLPQSRLIS